MSLTTGTRLGPYEILGLIGAGGMGEVYKARDTRLDRIVAIKLSKDHFSERFDREARAVAALNHPHISQLYDIGPNYLVMEFVEGVPIPVEDNPGKLLDVALQIADGLAAAHAAGIVHRDLKPANILLNRSGQVKILDFGLAMVARASMEATDARETLFNTGTGTTVGTVAYMSPEQARGETVDARSDLWSLGIVLYEMATRVRPFNGATSAIVFEALLGSKAPVPVRQLNPKISPDLERIIDRLLEKDRETRYQSAADVRADLKRVERGSSGKVTAAMPLPKSRRSLFRMAGAFGALLLFLGGISGLAYWVRPKVPVTSSSEYIAITDFADSATAPSLSADGRMVTFIRGGEFFYSPGQVYVKLLPNGESKQVTFDKSRKFAPGFTRDGSRIAYSRFWDTWTVPVLGGEPTLFLSNASGLTWIRDRLVLFSEVMAGTAIHMGLVTATEGRADSREIYFPPHQSGMVHYSYLSPDYKSILAVEMNQSHAFVLPCRLLPFDGSSAGRLVGPPGTCTAAAWSPDGHWMYFGARVKGSAHIWRQKFPDGIPEQITFGPMEEEGIAMDPDGLSFVTSVGNRRSTIWIHEGTDERPITSEGSAVAPRFSQNGKRVFYLEVQDLIASGNGWLPSSAELHSVDLATGKTDRLMPGVSMSDYVISRDEQDVAFTTKELDEKPTIWLGPLNRRTPPRQIAIGDSVSFDTGGNLVFRSLEGNKNFPARIKKDGTGLEIVTTMPILDMQGLSVDGKWVIASGDNGGVMFAIPLDGGEPRKVGAGRGTWSFDGTFFYAEMARESATSPGKTIAVPVPAGKSMPDLPVSGGYEALPGVQIIPHGPISPGLDPTTYVFTKTDLKRNLFRIPLH